MGRHHHPARSAGGGGWGAGWSSFVSQTTSSRAQRGGGSRGGRVKFMPRARNSVSVEDCQRLFSCRRCEALVVICSNCDRDNKYCSRECAREARKESQRASNRRYQATARGRSLHAARQGSYRRRQTAKMAKVTEQCRQADSSGVPLHKTAPLVCATCGAPRTSFLRYSLKRESLGTVCRPKRPKRYAFG